MKYSILFLLFFVLLLTGCKSVKLPETKTIVHEDQIDSLIIDGKKTGSFVNANINGKDIQLLFDTGASRSALKGLDLIGGEKALTKNNHLKDQQIGTASGSVETILYSADSLNLNAVTHRNYTCYLLNTPQMEFNCNSGLLRLNSKGVLGMNVFFDTDKALFLNYKDQYLELLNPENLNLKGYQEIEAEFNNNNTISVETIINGEKYDLLLDSGAAEFIILNKDPFKSQDQKLDMKSLNMMLANGLEPSKASVYKNKRLQISNLNINKNIIAVNESLDVNALGFKLMKNYNWILDLKNEKVYIKKVAESDVDKYFDKLSSVRHLAVAVNGRLMIAYSATDDYAIGSSIKSVNGEVVNEQNICDLQQLLIDNKDNWEDIDIEMY